MIHKEGKGYVLQYDNVCKLYGLTEAEIKVVEGGKSAVRA